MSIWLSNEKVSERKPIVLYFCSHRLCANRMYMKRAFGRVSIRKEVKSFSNYRPAKLSVRDVCLLQTHRDSPSTFRESSVSFTNTFRAPLGKEKAPLVFPLEWNKSLVSITCPLLSFSLSNSNNITYRETYLMSIGGTRASVAGWESKLRLPAGRHPPLTGENCSCNYSLLDLTDRPNTLGVLARTHRCGWADYKCNCTLRCS